MDNKPLINKQISIVSHQLKSGAKNPSIKFIEIIDGENNKYTFFPKKKDGTPTKAFEYYKSNQASWNDAILDGFQPKVEIAFDETEYPYVDNKGQQRIGKRRGIKFFKAIGMSKPIGDQNQAEYRIPTITADGIPVIEPVKPTKKKMDFDAPEIEEIPFGSSNKTYPEFPEGDLGDEYTD